MRNKDWPNLQRMFLAMCLLIISPLVGIAVGAVCWGSLERGLLVFNLLGLGGFALVTRPFWRGNRRRIRGLLHAALAMGFSALLDILSGRPVPFAVYFSSMVECFSLIPWITGILNEIHRGQWRAGPATASGPRPVPTERKTTPPMRDRDGGRESRPTPEGPELPVPHVPWWGYLLILLLLVLVAGLLLWGAGVWPEPAAGPRRLMP